MKANEIKKGAAIEVDGQTILVKQLQVQSPSSRSGSTLYKVRGQNVVSRQKFERSFKGDEAVNSVDLIRRPVQLLYKDGDGVTFMDSESYEQYILSEDSIEEELKYIAEGLEGMLALITDEVILGIELPTTVVLEITECAPGMKGASASARTKPATLSTGLVVQVPEYLEVGEVIKVNTDSADYISRA
ncbi:elongation factor P-like protein YeiP [Solemya pervernicosa gill symbiont]|uniref:Elongation factor P-like protein n=2 Tax=Gammaproteobacteria incertae sedis TaxID=118884 RepID=A0A1T2L5T8_9GAMM|nr:elongation factor P-like protein YeiP [Candidatus Reidiella endopervernicosa]OOZ40441.1 elongation factor P-like protein YeiP [Solemya pervernicosa gill symbiont]QKQ25355.1 elongation factor P-like protein YeiP [Candidatus Reidiella endopervernicosa]